MDSNSPSRMYKCSNCDEVKAHNKGDEFISCPTCNKNSWVIINKDKDYLISTQHANTVQSDIKVKGY
ncbi:MAG: hypothetical protein PF570_05930 [Candidatus Cloacimonetes bacterium]|jgi:DNA-directed RNA polymerase subunit RPC12/RpoP|nr:hypothetical protein [Candidatus Cloacimonadota bacterium]